jgi:hypothetical protein
MATLTETVIDIADRHTTLFYLDATPPIGAPLPLGGEAPYCALHRRVATPPRVEYGDVAGGKAPAILGRLTAPYVDNRYWHRFLGNSAIEAYPDDAWQQQLPVITGLTKRVVYVPGSGLSAKVSPLPRVILYPFGWSTWISLRLVGAHTISELSTFLQQLFASQALCYEGGSGEAFSAPTFFKEVARNVRADAFGGAKTRDLDPQDVAVVATVMAKHGGSPALGALGGEDQKELLRIARPYGPPPNDPFTDHVYRLVPGNDLEYLIHDKHGRFIWVEHLLEPIDWKYRHLRCYHNNSFTSLVHAWQLHGFLDAVARQRPLTQLAYDMAQNAGGALESPRYKCASLVQYLQEPAAKASVTKAAALAAPAPPVTPAPPATSPSSPTPG